MDEVDLEKMRSIGSGMKYPVYSPTEDRTFDSKSELDTYVKENKLASLPVPPRRKRNVRTYRYDKKLKKVVEVT